MTAPTFGKVVTVPNSRGRPSDYTPEEDAIILKHRDTLEVQRLLKAAGFPERTPPAIWSRRKYLHEVGASELTTQMVAAHELLPVLSARREKLRVRLAALDRERAFINEQIAELSAEMHRLIDGDGVDGPPVDGHPFSRPSLQ